MPGGAPLRVLLVEDSTVDAQLVSDQMALVRPPGFAVSHAGRISDALDALSREHVDVVLLDLGLPDANGLDGLAQIRAGAPGVAIVVRTGLSDESIALEALDLGAQDYIVKGRPDQDDGIERSIRYALARRQAESAQRRLAAIVESSDDAIVGVSPDETIMSWNAAAEQLYGYSADEAIGRSAEILLSGEPAEQERVIMARVLAGARAETYEIQRRRNDGRVVEVSVTISPIVDSVGVVVGASAIARDVTERRRAQERFRQLLEAAPVAMVIVDQAASIMLVNAQTESLFGYPRAELVGQPVELLVPERMRAAHVGHVRRFFLDPSIRPVGAAVELWAARKDGHELPVEISLSPLDTDGGVLVSAAIRDVTERRRAAETSRRLAAIVENTEDAVIAKTPQGIITEWNQGAERLYGYAAEQAVGMDVRTLIPADRDGEEGEILRRVTSGGRVEHYDTVRVREDGSRIDVSLTVSPIRDASGKIMAASTIGRDITERKRFEGQLQYLADHDPITGLYNRRRFGDELDRELARARRYDSGGAVVAIDLDHFKYINDSLGHAAGDQLITQAADIFRRHLRTTDILARLGGDEFAIILPGVDDAQAQLVASNLLAAIRSESHIETAAGTRGVTASIGVATFTGSLELAGEELLVEADIAMYDAKEQGRDRSSIYDLTEHRQQQMRTRLTWADRIRAALDEERFLLHAQPILALTDDTAPRHELLIRMIGEDGDIIPPGTFLYVAERFDLIQEIDAWVLRKAIGLLADQQAAGNDIQLQINISAKSLVRPELPQLLSDELSAAGVGGNGLCLEVTETAAIVNIDHAKTFANLVGQLGCQIALDDFGAGFASFYYLKHLTFDYLKIDGEFVVHLPHSHTNQLVVRSIVEIARGMGKRTIAEFVETQDTLDLLRSYGVNYAQGHHVAKPKAFRSGDLAVAAHVPV